jgi:hypothetical protein
MRNCRILTFALIACLSSLFSCKKQDNNDVSPTTPINKELITEIRASSPAVAKLAINGLSPEEKVVLWRQHFESYANNPSTSPELKSHILKLFPLLTVERFKAAGTPENDAFMDSFTNIWFTQPVAKRQFAKDELLSISTVFGFGSEPGSTTKKLAVNHKGSSTLSIDFPESDDPPLCGCRYSLSCDGSTYCRDGGCSGGANCGIAGTSSCTGRCH